MVVTATRMQARQRPHRENSRPPTPLATTGTAIASRNSRLYAPAPMYQVSADGDKTQGRRRFRSRTVEFAGDLAREEREDDGEHDECRFDDDGGDGKAVVHVARRALGVVQAGTPRILLNLRSTKAQSGIARGMRPTHCDS